jgi:hypothetical protein
VNKFLGFVSYVFYLRIVIGQENVVLLNQFSPLRRPHLGDDLIRFGKRHRCARNALGWMCISAHGRFGSAAEPDVEAVV